MAPEEGDLRETSHPNGLGQRPTMSSQTFVGVHTIYLLGVDGAVAHMSTRGKPEGVSCLLLCGFLRRCLGNTEGLLISFHAVTSLPVSSMHSLRLCLHGCEHMRLLSRYRRGTHATTAPCRG